MNSTADLAFDSSPPLALDRSCSTSLHHTTNHLSHHRTLVRVTPSAAAAGASESGCVSVKPEPRLNLSRHNLRRERASQNHYDWMAITTVQGTPLPSPPMLPERLVVYRSFWDDRAQQATGNPFGHPESICRQGLANLQYRSRRQKGFSARTTLIYLSSRHVRDARPTPGATKRATREQGLSRQAREKRGRKQQAVAAEVQRGNKAGPRK